MSHLESIDEVRVTNPLKKQLTKNASNSNQRVNYHNLERTPMRRVRIDN